MEERGWDGGVLVVAPRCCCLLSKVCNALQSSPIPFYTHVCMQIHNGSFFWHVDRVLCSSNLNFIQMRIKWPRLFKEYAGSVDLNKHCADGVCFHTVMGVWKYLIC